MKKIVYLCAMMLMSMNIMAQIDINDQNWSLVFGDDFSVPGRSWIEGTWLSCPDGKWRATSSGSITHGVDEHQVYHHSNCHFDDTNQKMELVAEYDYYGDIPNHNYTLPNGINNYPTGDLYYFSGTMDCTQKFRYGYFEIRCKLPVHQGAFPAFWLWNGHEGNGAFYEEIDIFEYSWWITTTTYNPSTPGFGSPRCFTCGFIFNDTANVLEGHDHAQTFPILPSTSPDLSEWHTFSCEWLPDHIIWYCDDNVCNSYFEADTIPHRKLTLKVNYAIDNYYQHNGTPWPGGIMTIDYVKVYQLNWDCSTDEVIAQQSDLDYFNYAVKKSITITSAIEPVNIESTNKVTFRATDSFEINGSFQVDSTGELTVIMQQCPSES